MTDYCLCKLSHDITFCSGLRCDRANTCALWIRNHTFPEKGRVAIAQFADHDWKCTDYKPTETTNEVL